MLRVFLHWLLVFGLVCSGVSSPWAMAHAHGGEPREASTPVVEAPAMHDHAMHAQHAHEGHASHAGDQADTGHHGDCGGSNCQCGCVMPPALAYPASLPMPAAADADPAVAALPAVVVHRSTGPFRPPAIRA